jgi:hypothetical protein
MKLTAEQATKIATMMLNAAKYEKAWIDVAPVEMPRDGREEMISDIADALVNISHGYIKKEDAVKQLSRTSGNNRMEFYNLSHEQIEALSKEFCTAPVYTNKKGKQFTFYHGVWSQGYSYFHINVGLFVEYALVGYCKDKRRQYYNIMKALGEVEITTEHHFPVYHEPKESNEINDLKR